MEEEELEKLKEIADSIRRINSKVLLMKLLEKAKNEYDKYDFDSGLETLKEAYKIDCNNPVVLRGIGCMEQFRGNYDIAIEYFFRALEVSTSKEIEYTLIGMAYYLQDKLEDAVKYFNLAIDINDNYEKAYEGRNQAMLESHIQIIDLQEMLKKYF